MNYFLRQAQTSDLAALILLDRASDSAAHWSEEQYRDAIASMISDPAASLRRIVLLAVQAETPVQLAARLTAHVTAMLIGKAVAGEWEVENLAVLPAFRRRGMAAALVAKLLEIARQGNATGIFLEVRESNLAARKLYERFNFLQTGRRPGYYQNPAEAAILYALQLHP